MPSDRSHDLTPFPVLIGDIGGTNARFALIPDRDAPMEVFPSVATASFADVETAIKAVLARSSHRPRSAIIDGAGPITADGVDLTNADWNIRPAETIRRTGIGEVILLNDFEALALAVAAFLPADLQPLGPALAGRSGARVVIGPGTGLGVGALIDAGGVLTPIPSEGGHVSLGPVEADEFPVWANIEPEHGRISAEAILSGRGLVRLYRAVARLEGVEAAFTQPPEITAAALAGSDEMAARTTSLWGRLLGRFAGDMALVFMAQGGAYIGGGIPPRILPILQSGEFRRAFEAKAPHEEVMAAIPAWLITGDNPALTGLSAFAREPERFGVSLQGRRWRRP